MSKLFWDFKVFKPSRGVKSDTFDNINFDAFPCFICPAFIFSSVIKVDV